jgi:hypothetical protein
MISRSPGLLVVATVVALLAASEASGAQLTATWVDNSGALATTRLERRLESESDFTPIADLPPGTTSYVDGPLPFGTAYCYRAMAYNEYGISSPSNEACATAGENPSIVVGLGSGGWGALGALGPTPPHLPLRWPRLLGWDWYNSFNGEVRPALCDVDGDGKKEVVLGLGRGSGGWLEVLDDAQAGHELLTWLQIGWPAYNAYNGETFPACGDLDGDGLEEIVVGLGRGGGGWLQVFDDATLDFAPLSATPSLPGWLQLSWPAYNAASGEVRPAVGDLDGDGRAELVLGLGPGGAGWVQVLDDALNRFAPLAPTPTPGGWFQVPWAAYNSANGETRPAVCDLDGNGQGEIVLGLGPGAWGWVHLRGGAASGFAALPETPVLGGWPALGGWLLLSWTDYNLAQGETFPACGELDGDGRDELVLGLGSYPENGGWLEVRDDLTSGLVHASWARVDWGAYNNVNGLTRPVLGR